MELLDMSSKPRRRSSRELPIDFSDLINKVLEDSVSFTSQLDINEPKMRKIVEELLGIPEKVNAFQERIDRQKTTGDGAALIADVNKRMKKEGITERVEKLGNKFQNIVEPMKQNLVKIHKTCEELEENVTKYQVEKSLEDVEELQWILQRVSELKKSEVGLSRHDVSIKSMTNLLVLNESVARDTATPEENKEFLEAVVQSADQNQVVEDFNLMKEEVTKFRRELQEMVPVPGRLSGVELLINPSDLMNKVLEDSSSIQLLIPLLVEAAAGRGSAIAYEALTEMMWVKGIAERVEQLGNNFLNIVEPMKQNLVKIHKTCEELEENVTKYQIEKSLEDVEELQRILQRVSELKRKSEGAVHMLQVLMESMTNLLVLNEKVVRDTATPEGYKELMDAIVQSADQSQKVTENFCQMRDEVTKFRK